MATKRQRKNGTWELKIQRKDLLKAPVYLTFQTPEEADLYADKVEALLDRGIVPIELTGASVRDIDGLIDAYETGVTLSKSDQELLPVLRKTIGREPIKVINYHWVERYVETMKARQLAPSTLKKRAGLLARVVDHAMRKGLVSFVTNPVRMLPRGYASAGIDKNVIWDGERDRRLEAAEEGALRKVLVKKEEHLLLDLALETGMRMREMFTLTVAQVDLRNRTIFLDRTKNGSKRQVPMSSVICALLSDHLAGKEESDLVFSFWDGVENPSRCTNRLSHLFAARFKKAGLKNFHFHDLRREATSRFYEKTTMTDGEIASITGHKDLRMLRRYSNLRGSTLSAKLW